MTTRGGGALLAAAALAMPALGAASGSPIDFGRDIRPLFSDHCYACHGPDQAKRKAGLRLDVQEDALKKLDSGAFAIVPGRPDQSRLLEVILLPPEKGTVSGRLHR